jgi:hypothetical protein
MLRLTPEQSSTNEIGVVPYYLQPKNHPLNLNIKKGDSLHPTSQSFIPNMLALNHPLIQFRIAVESYFASLENNAYGNYQKKRNKRPSGLQPPVPPSIPPKMTVALWPLFEFNMSTAEELHILFDGVSQSPYLQMAPSPGFRDHFFSEQSVLADNLVWIGDTGSNSIGYHEFCDRLVKHVNEAQAVRAHHGMVVQWPIVIFDASDEASPKQRCENLEKIIGREFVFYTKRSIVERRQWDDTTQWVKVGHLTDLHLGTLKEKYMNYYHAPLAVRTDTVVTLQTILQDENFHSHYHISRGALEVMDDEQTARPTLSLSSPIESILERPIDVAHFWPLGNTTELAGQLRDVVSHIIINEFSNKITNNYNAYVGIVGDSGQPGRQGVATRYMEKLLNTKILVLTQRTNWEDHYRLFEGLVSGVMVMTDRMLSLPAGLKNGTSIVEFTSADDLVAKVIYYLEHPEERIAIATAGRYIAMSRHRSWHRMEDLIYGVPVTQCLTSVNVDCPFIVHAKEGVINPSSGGYIRHKGTSKIDVVFNRNGYKVIGVH